jgi:hypothetical protein
VSSTISTTPGSPGVARGRSVVAALSGSALGCDGPVEQRGICQPGRVPQRVRDVGERPRGWPVGTCWGRSGCGTSASRLGGSTGYPDLRYLFEEAWAGAGRSSETFLANVERATSLTANPLFAILHETSYCGRRASNWSAVRILAEFPHSMRGTIGSPSPAR